MATYKVPQDVEAEDKIVGFLSLKQLIMVIIMIAALYMCYVLASVNILLGLIPLPIALVYGVLGLYQRKDQPVETFLASFFRFKLKPRKRVWDQEGFEVRVIITAPKVMQKSYTKGLSDQQVSSRLSQLSAMMDSRGWASKQMMLQQSAASVAVNDLYEGSPDYQADNSQRLLSPSEMIKYSTSQLPIDGEIAKQTDVLEDPTSRVYSQVDNGLSKVEAKIKSEVDEVVEEARESRKEYVEPIEDESTPTTPTQSASSPTLSEPSSEKVDIQPPKQQNSVAESVPLATTPEDETVITIKHDK